jgi:hypothetical protein
MDFYYGLLSFFIVCGTLLLPRPALDICLTVLFVVLLGIIISWLTLAVIVYAQYPRHSGLLDRI